MILLPAFAATVIWWLLTFSTRYPFLVDDYTFAWKARLPGWSPQSFDFLLSQRPLATLLNTLMFGSGIFERTKILFVVFYFLHAVGAVLIFRYLVQEFLGREVLEEKKRDAGLFCISVLICLFPGWYELTLLTSTLPFGLGVLFVGLSLFSRSALQRGLLYFLAFCSMETYLLPIALFTFHELLKDRARWKELLIPPFVAGVSYLALQQALVRGLGLPPSYVISFDPWSMLGTAKTYFGLLYYQSFYKVNWVSTAVELGTLVVVIALLVRRDRRWGARAALLFVIPCLAAGHSVLLAGYYAPRAIHGAMVLRAATTGVLLLAFLLEWRRGKTAWRAWIPATLVLLAYLGQHGLIVSNRSHNERILRAREEAIVAELKTCVSPCHVSLAGIENELRWDWIMRPVFHMPFVELIRLRNGIDKEVIVR